MSPKFFLTLDFFSLTASFFSLLHARKSGAGHGVPAARGQRSAGQNAGASLWTERGGGSR
jgi:hypothetical protein